MAAASAAALRSLRLCLRTCRPALAPRRPAPAPVSFFGGRRAISSTPRRLNSQRDDEEEDELDREEEEAALRAQLPDYAREILDKLDDLDYNKQQEQLLDDLEKEMQTWDEAVMAASEVPKRIPRTHFWLEDEEDPDYLIEGDDDDNIEDDIMSMAHGKLEEHREFREYARIAAWQMPLLSKLAKNFEPPKEDECLRFRYTTYMGENHPAQSKVVLEFSPQDMPLDDAQKMKLRKLLGPRWNPQTDVAKMSCEQFDHQAQNKRYLGDLVLKLVEKAKDPSDMFEDVPLDMRHHVFKGRSDTFEYAPLDMRHHEFKPKPKFPVAWRLTEERIKELEDIRQKALLLDQEKEQAGALIDGDKKVQDHFFKPLPEPVLAGRQRFPPLASLQSAREGRPLRY